MTLIRIGDAPRPCSHPEHFPPNMIVLPPGVYRHVCPGCGKATEFTEHGGPWCGTSARVPAVSEAPNAGTL